MASVADGSGSAVPVVRWDRSWSAARPFPAPPAHAIGNTPGIKVASTKAHFYKWKPAPEKEPVDFSEDDLYIIEVSDDDEQEDEVMSVDKKDETEASTVNAVEPQNEQAVVDASAAPINYDDANDGTMMETDGVQGGGEDEDEESQDFSSLKMALGGLPGAGGRSGPLKLNTLATRFLNDQRHEHHDTPPNSAI
ncbi:hypothetical protein HDU80_004008 [Chytriomyces hyalinus]|nr:hypothetical protein HDU80_004008 [Chytriomyces hyalinus]